MCSIGDGGIDLRFGLRNNTLSEISEESECLIQLSVNSGVKVNAFKSWLNYWFVGNCLKFIKQKKKQFFFILNLYYLI